MHARKYKILAIIFSYLSYFFSQGNFEKNVLVSGAVTHIIRSEILRKKKGWSVPEFLYAPFSSIIMCVIFASVTLFFADVTVFCMEIFIGTKKFAPVIPIILWVRNGYLLCLLLLM